MDIAMLFILISLGFCPKRLCLPANPIQTEMRGLNFCGSMSKTAGLQSFFSFYLLVLQLSGN
jgi:hypothetical protein